MNDSYFLLNILLHSKNDEEVPFSVAFSKHYTNKKYVVGCLKTQLEFVEEMVRCRQEFNILAPLPKNAERGSNRLIVQGC